MTTRIRRHKWPPDSYDEAVRRLLARAAAELIAVNYFKTQGMSFHRDCADSSLILALLGRSAGGTFAGSGDIDQGEIGHAGRDLWICGRGADYDFDVYLGFGCDLDAGAVRVLQLHHVPEHLYPGHFRTGANDEQGIGTDYDGGGRRRSNSMGAGRARRPGWHPARVCHSVDLLPLHCLLRILGVEAGKDSC